MPAWKRYNLGDIPQLPGVYAVFMDDKLVYIGSSKDTRFRAAQHGLIDRKGPTIVTKKWGACRNIVVKVRIVLLPGDWLRREYRLILRLRPPENRVIDHRQGPLTGDTTRAKKKNFMTRVYDVRERRAWPATRRKTAPKVCKQSAL